MAAATVDGIGTTDDAIVATAGKSSAFGAGSGAQDPLPALFLTAPSVDLQQ
jgi:hypothetical protein